MSDDTNSFKVLSLEESKKAFADKYVKRTKTQEKDASKAIFHDLLFPMDKVTVDLAVKAGYTNQHLKHFGVSKVMIEEVSVEARRVRSDLIGIADKLKTEEARKLEEEKKGRDASSSVKVEDSKKVKVVEAFNRGYSYFTDNKVSKLKLVFLFLVVSFSATIFYYFQTKPKSPLSSESVKQGSAVSESKKSLKANGKASGSARKNEPETSASAPAPITADVGREAKACLVCLR
jgi:hypothetical protein